MSHKRVERINRLRAVEREYLVVAVTVERLRVALADGRIVLPQGTTVRDLEAARLQLEPTFLIRLWAEFETAVRSYYSWLTNDPDPVIKAIHLIDSLAASRRGRPVAETLRDEVHAVRQYRNALVHDRDDPALPVSLSDARRRLNTYLGGKLPEQWG